MRVLVIGHIRHCHRQLHADGHATVLFMPRDRLGGADLAAPHESIVALDADASPAQWLNCALGLQRARPFDAVVCYTDRYQALAGHIARGLGVFCIVDEALLARTTDKFLMRQALDSRGLPHCRYRRAQGRAQLLEAIAAIGYPCILKPVAGQASVGVARLGSDADVERAMEWVGEHHIGLGVIVEEFLEGQEYSVEAISVAGHHHIIALTMKFKDPLTFVEIGHVVPAPLDPEVKRRIEDYVSDVLTALGFRDTTSHTEVILTDAGPRIVETHTRLAGDYIPELARHATGIDLYALSARQSIGAPLAGLLPERVTALQSAAVWYACPAACAEQYLDEVRGIEQAAALAGVCEVVVLKKKGDGAGPVRQSFDRSACAIAVGGSAELATAASRRALGMLDFLYRSSAAPAAAHAGATVPSHPTPAAP